MSLKVLIVAGEFNDMITNALLSGASKTFDESGINYESIWVPGAFELPLAAKAAAKSKKWDAIVCLGCVIRGETPHFDYVCSQAASGIMSTSLEENIPIIFGVLTTDTAEQALSRSGLKGGNKGVESAHAAIKMIKVLKELN